MSTFAMIGIVGSVVVFLELVVAAAVLGRQLLIALEDFIAEDDGAS